MYVLYDTIEPHEGQYWEYREDPWITWTNLPCILTLKERINSVPNVCYVLETSLDIQGLKVENVLVRFLKVGNGFRYEIGEEVWFDRSVFNEHESFNLIWDIEEEQKEVKYGVYCGNCGGYYPYAIFSEDFRCWGCRHGF